MRLVSVSVILIVFLVIFSIPFIGLLPRRYFYRVYFVLTLATSILMPLLHLLPLPSFGAVAIFWWAYAVFLLFAVASLRFLFVLISARIQGHPSESEAVGLFRGVLWGVLVLLVASVVSVFSCFVSAVALFVGTLVPCYMIWRSARLPGDYLFAGIGVGISGMALAINFIVAVTAYASLRQLVTSENEYCVQLARRVPVVSVWQFSPFAMRANFTGSGLLSKSIAYENHARLIIRDGDSTLRLYHWAYSSLSFEHGALVTKANTGESGPLDRISETYSNDFVCIPQRDFISTLRWY